MYDKKKRDGMAAADLDTSGPVGLQQNNSDHLAGGAGGGVQWQALPAGSTRALHQAREALLGPVADGLSRRAAVDSIDQVLATPAPKGDAKDAERLDWLDSQGVSYGFEDMHEGNSWSVSGPFSNVRVAIDAAILASKGGAS